MRAIGGHWSHAGGWSVSRRHASLKYPRNADWWSGETHWRDLPGGGWGVLSACKRCLRKPLRSGTRRVSGRSLGADWATLQELPTQGQRSLTERCQMQWDTPRERETDYQIRLLLTSPPLSLPPFLSVWVCSCVMTHHQPLSVNAAATSPYIAVCLRVYSWV